MWGLVFASFAVFGVLGVIYLIFGIRRFAFFKKLVGKNKIWNILCILIPAIIVGTLLLWNVMNAVVVILHWLVFWVICDILAVLVRRIRGIKKNDSVKPYLAGIIAVIITASYIVYGWFSAHNVVETDYTVETTKLENGESLRIIMLSDSHTGAIFDGDEFMDYAKEIEKLHPDLVVMVGDMVDDGTTYENMVMSCKALGSISSTYGSYYVFGNHDKRYFGNGYYTVEQLRESLAEYGVKILEDERSYIFDDKVCIVGRQDANVKDRKPAVVLRDTIPDDVFTVVLDHQPNDYKAESGMNFDLVLSGHTHGGQMFPIGLVSKIFGMNDMIYGIDTIGNTTFIVSSGIADWEIPFKMGCCSEYVVIDVLGK